MNKLVSESIDHLVGKKHDEFTESYTAFVKECAAKIIESNRVVAREAAFEQMKATLIEITELPVKFEGDAAFINGRKVGDVTTDLNDFDSGINFTDVTGNFSKEFDSLEDLSKFLMMRYGSKTESLVLMSEDELATVVSEAVKSNSKLLKKTKSLTESKDFAKMAKYVLDKEYEFIMEDKATLLYIGKTLEKKWKS